MARDLVTWDPFAELEDVRQTMDRIVRSAFGDLRLPDPARVTSWVPAVDIEETDEAFVVEAEVPGARRDDVTVDLRGNELTIRGEVTERERTGVVRRRARRTGRFEYRVTLPADVDGDRVTATLRDGVLHLEVPKVAAVQPRRIEITTG